MSEGCDSLFSKGVEAMTDAEQKVADAVARAFETLSERLSRELAGAFNQMAQQIGRVQKQQLEIVDLVSRQAEAIRAREKIRDGDVERHNEYARAIRAAIAGPDEDCPIYRRPCHTIRATLQGVVESPGRRGKGGVRSELQPPAVDAASELKRQDSRSKDWSSRQPKAWAIFARCRGNL